MEEEKSFYPHYLFEIVVVIFIVLDITLLLSFLKPIELGRQINLQAVFQPKPEWYFLWLFEILKYFPGSSAVIGAVVMPVGFILMLAMIPFIDKGKRGRLKAYISMVVLVLSFVVFNILSALDI
ncbi:MAG: hypothetical protein L3V56_06045 [Candidatus Magnetoovum sp. WYHC-5]|nr:hypothetical protein [Candidatus Magnetoovum sp. WYHC-5]